MDIASSLNELSSEKLTIAGVALVILLFVLLKIGLGIVKKVVLLVLFLAVGGFFLFGRG